MKPGVSSFTINNPRAKQDVDITCSSSTQSIIALTLLRTPIDIDSTFLALVHPYMSTLLTKKAL